MVCNQQFPQASKVSPGEFKQLSSSHITRPYTVDFFQLSQLLMEINGNIVGCCLRFQVIEETNGFRVPCSCPKQASKDTGLTAVSMTQHISYIYDMIFFLYIYIH